MSHQTWNSETLKHHQIPTLDIFRCASLPLALNETNVLDLPYEIISWLFHYLVSSLGFIRSLNTWKKDINFIVIHKNYLSALLFPLYKSSLTFVVKLCRLLKSYLPIRWLPLLKRNEAIHLILLPVHRRKGQTELISAPAGLRLMIALACNNRRIESGVTCALSFHLLIAYF